MVGADGRLLGTVTDGDLRRAILMSVPQEVPIVQVMHRQFTAVGPEASDAEVLELMKRKTVKAIPVLDHAGRLLDLDSAAEQYRKLQSQ